MPDDRDVIDAVEAAFGPGAFELIAEMEAAEMTALEELGAGTHTAGIAATVATTVASPWPPSRAAGQGVAVGKRVSEQPQPQPPQAEQPRAEPREPEQQTLLLFELAEARFASLLPTSSRSNKCPA